MDDSDPDSDPDSNPLSSEHRSILSSRDSRPATPPRTLRESISPPPSRNRRVKPLDIAAHAPTRSSLEAGHTFLLQSSQLQYWSQQLRQHVRPGTLLPIEEWQRLYEYNQHSDGKHFVIHQHDHPVAGLHYDLRVQINASSSASWAVMYGLPGLANGRRVNRNATETRVHALWNHLIETASKQTGSMLIWDTGTYSIVPYHQPAQLDPETTDDDSTTTSASSDERSDTSPTMPEPERLAQSFKNRKIRLRLHGVRLPAGYTITLRLFKGEDRSSQPPARSRKRKRKRKRGHRAPSPPSTPRRSVSPSSAAADVEEQTIADASEAEDEEIDDEIRRNNAYLGATNTIGSIHQRRWFLSLDRRNSGFEPGIDGLGKRVWVRRRRCRQDEPARRECTGEHGKETLEGWEGFVVGGRDVERSVLTGRTAAEVMEDEGVEGWVGRKGWHPVVE